MAKLHMMAVCLTAVFGTANQTIGVNVGIVLDEWCEGATFLGFLLEGVRIFGVAALRFLGCLWW